MPAELQDDKRLPSEANPVSRVHQLDQGFDAVIARTNQTVRSVEDLLLHTRFELRAASGPDALAVICGGASLTYGELEQRATQLAHQLRTQGCRPRQRIGSCFNWGFPWVIAQLAIQKLGAVYVPLDPAYPAARRALILADAQITHVCTEEQHRSLFPDSTVIGVDAGDSSSQSGPHNSSPRGALHLTEPLSSPYGDAPLPAAKPSDTAYVMYTSGTTGTPNGVMVSHRAAHNTIDWVTRQFNIAPGDRLLAVSAPTFDLSVFDVFGVLGAGATLVLPDEGDLLDTDALRRLVVDAEITLWNSTPAILGAHVHAWPAQLSNKLRLVLLSGDWIPLTLPAALWERFPSAQVVSLGGATEAAIWSNWYPVGAVDPSWSSVPYGSPIQNCRYYVLDADLRPVTFGVPGDLYIAGTCLADGYLNRAELTARRFIANPFEPGQRMYATGDRAEYFTDGQLRLLGRSDAQVKVRGFRIELGEVQAALASLPGVREAAVTTYDDGAGRSLAAFVVMRADAHFDLDAVRQGLASLLPQQAVPTRLSALSALPLSQHGKVDLRALTQLASQAPEAAPGIAPRTEEERQIARVWQQALGRPVGMQDDFFAVGGNSLLAVQVAARLASELQLKVTGPDLIAHPTIEALLSELTRRASAPRRELFLKLNVQRGTQRSPLVFFPGLYGTLVDFHALPRMFEAEQPVLMADSFSIAEKARASVGNIATRYLHELLEQGEDGRALLAPSVLCGYSFGSLTAFEVAEQLRRAGRTVQGLISLDGYAPGYPEFLPIGPRLVAHLTEFAFGETGAYLRKRAEGIRRRAFRALGREYDLSPKVLSTTPELHTHFKTVFETNLRASQTYRPQTIFNGPFLLIRAKTPIPWVGVREIDPLYGWKRYVQGEISVVEIPGDHAALFREENRPLVVRAIRDFMARVGAR